MEPDTDDELEKDIKDFDKLNKKNNFFNKLLYFFKDNILRP